MFQIASWFGENANPGNGTGSLRMGTSSDGITWNSMNWPYGGTHNIRDPSITMINGIFAIVYTGDNVVVSGTNSFMLMTSSYVNSTWTDMTPVPVALAIGTAQLVYAPEWFIDPHDNSIHVIFAASTNTSSPNFDFYETHPSTNSGGSINLGTWSTPSIFLTTGGTWALDKQRIDPTVVFRDSMYYLFYAQEAAVSAHIGLASSSALLGTWTMVDDNYSNTKNWGITVIEGPTIVNRQGTWWAYCDKFSDGGDSLNGGHIIYVTSTDTWATWSTNSSISIPNWPQAKHGTVFINGVEVVGTNTYTYFGQTYQSTANNGTATNNVEYVFGATSQTIDSTPIVGTSGVVTGGGNLTGYKGDGNGILGRG